MARAADMLRELLAASGGSRRAISAGGSYARGTLLWRITRVLKKAYGDMR